jgi:hypothetical protein
VTPLRVVHDIYPDRANTVVMAVAALQVDRTYLPTQYLLRHVAHTLGGNAFVIWRSSDSRDGAANV